jgi:hypothetical protein
MTRDETNFSLALLVERVAALPSTRRLRGGVADTGAQFVHCLVRLGINLQKEIQI